MANIAVLLVLASFFLLIASRILEKPKLSALSLIFIALVFLLLGLFSNSYDIEDKDYGAAFRFSEAGLMKAVDSKSIDFYERRAGLGPEKSCVT